MKRLLLLLLMVVAPCYGADPFEPIIPGRAFSFPQDHLIHPRSQTEWWYVTANLKGEDGLTYGAQFTLFSNAVMIANLPQRIFFAHAALATPSQFFYGERYAKAGVGNAGVSTLPWQAFIDHWQFSGTETAPLPGTLSVNEPTFAFQLNLSASPYFLQGEQGFSRKNATGSLASYYYNAPFITLDGEIKVNSKTIKVTGHAWLDREWSSGVLAGNGLPAINANKTMDNIGWDWLAIHLTDSEALMLYRVRSGSETYLSGSIMQASGAQQALTAEQIQWLPIDPPKAINGHRYPLSWQLKIPSHNIDITVSPLNPNQQLNTTVTYWEGAIQTRGSHSAQGYLELFGY